MRPRHLLWWEALASYPPYYLRIFAKKDANTSLSDAEIAIAANIPINRVRQIWDEPDWNKVTLGEYMALAFACRFDPTRAADRHRVDQYDYICMKRQATGFRYLRKSPKWETEILPLLLRMKQSRQKSAAA